jgi:hypothetical protein
MNLSFIEVALRGVMEKVSNSEPIDVTSKIKEEFLADMSEAFDKQFNRDPSDPFRIRMSNMGKHSCQLQMNKAGAKKIRKPYNFIMRMLIGDAVEAWTMVFLKLAKADITGGKDIVSLDIADTTIKGESDVDIEGKVFDIKSSAPWAFKNKWQKGFDAVKRTDDFGYVGQLYGYSEGQKKPMGGWIVVDKSSGETVVVEADLSDAEKQEIRGNIETTINKVNSDSEFERCFEPEDEFFNRKPTGNKRLGITCTFCDYRSTCWPDAQYKPQTGSQAKEPRHFWYSDYTPWEPVE